MTVGKPSKAIPVKHCGVAMEQNSSNPCPNEQLIKLANALGSMRDSFVTISMTLKDLADDLPSTARDEVETEVERYLARLSEAKKRNFD